MLSRLSPDDENAIAHPSHLPPDCHEHQLCRERRCASRTHLPVSAIYGVHNKSFQIGCKSCSTLIKAQRREQNSCFSFLTAVLFLHSSTETHSCSCRSSSPSQCGVRPCTQECDGNTTIQLFLAFDFLKVVREVPSYTRLSNRWMCVPFSLL